MPAKRRGWTNHVSDDQISEAGHGEAVERDGAQVSAMRRLAQGGFKQKSCLCRQCEHGAACPPALAAIKEGAGDFPTHCHQCECGHIEPIEAAPGAAIGLRLMRRG